MGFQIHGTHNWIWHAMYPDWRYFEICAERLDEPWNNNDPRLNCVIRAAIVQRAVRFDNLFRNVLVHTLPVTVHINDRGLFIIKHLLADRRTRSIYSSIGTSKIFSDHKSQRSGPNVAPLIFLIVSKVTILTLHYAWMLKTVIVWFAIISCVKLKKIWNVRYFFCKREREREKEKWYLYTVLNNKIHFQLSKEMKNIRFHLYINTELILLYNRIF